MVRKRLLLAVCLSIGAGCNMAAEHVKYVLECRDFVLDRLVLFGGGWCVDVFVCLFLICFVLYSFFPPFFNPSSGIGIK